MATPSKSSTRAQQELSAQPDAALLALQPEIDAADEAWEACYRELSAAEDVFALKPGKPEMPILAPDKLLKAFRAGLLPADKEAWDRYRQADEAWQEQAERESGLTAAEEAVEAADVVRLAIRDEKIVPTRARTLAGLIFKARYAASHFPGDPDDDVMRSIVEDLLAMSPAGEAA